MPLWVIPLLSYSIFATNKPIITQAITLTGDGESFVYSAASLGPLFYIIVKKYGQWNSGESFPLVISFPSGPSFLLFSLFVCISSGFFFGVIRIPELQSSSLPIDHLSAIRIGAVMFIAALICLFCASAYRNAIEEFVRNINLNEDDVFSVKWKAARNAK